MRKGVFFIAGFLVVLSVSITNGQQLLMGKQLQVRGKYVAGQVIVKFKPGITEQAIESVNKLLGTASLMANHRGFRVLRISDKRTVEEMIAKYKADPAVEYAEPDFIAYAFSAPNDPYYQYQWHLDNAVNGGIHAEAAWDITTGDPSVVIGVIGTGVAYENYSQKIGIRTYNYYSAPDLAGTRFVAGWDFVNNDAHANDDEGHETHVCGTIAQATNNSTGTAGIAYNSTIMPVKVLDAKGQGSYSNVANGIIWAVDHGARIINLSLGGPSSSITIEDACRYAYEHDVTMICAAGNDNTDSISYPAAYNNYCISVGAVRFDETRSYYSNYGKGLVLVAPGGDVNVDQNGDSYVDGVLQMTFGDPRYSKSVYYYDTWNYYFYQGTSMATPHVTGVAALLMAAGVAETPDQIRNVLQSTADDLGPLGYDEEYGWGLVNAEAALKYSPVPNTAPVAEAGSQYSGTEDIAVAFNGSGSYDAENDPLTYSWNFGDGSTGSGIGPSHAYAAGGEYTVTLVVNDGKANSGPSITTAIIEEVNDAPIANAGPDKSAHINEAVQFDGSGSYDPDGTIAFYRWDFGDGSTATGASVSHVFASAGTYTVMLTVTDNSGTTAQDNAVATITQVPVEIEVFNDDFEIAEWYGLWTEDSQNDWYRSSQRSTSGSFSAEVDGSANNAQLISIPVNLQGKTTATITFSWLIESSLDANEYISFEVSTNGGSTWVEKARLKGNVDPEDIWQSQTISLTGISNLKMRFKGKMSGAEEDADVDAVRVVAR